MLLCGGGHMSKASKRKMEYIANYEAENYDKVLIRLPRGTKDRIKATGATVNGFISTATLQALDNAAQPAQAPQPQPVTTPATVPAASTPQPPEGYTLIPDRPGLEPIKVLLPVDKRYNQRIYAAVKQGRAPSGAMYVMAALDKQLAADEADEKRKLDLYFAAMDDDY